MQLLRPLPRLLALLTQGMQALLAQSRLLPPLPLRLLLPSCSSQRQPVLLLSHPRRRLSSICRSRLQLRHSVSLRALLLLLPPESWLQAAAAAVVDFPWAARFLPLHPPQRPERPLRRPQDLRVIATGTASATETLEEKHARAASCRAESFF
jgi:hypothetical protein